ncbi:hypothetical protein DRN63_03570 [Nanoarchaeota archaeon]|nr:MAG: hypothetical protein DRN63_03570 [Nanoarchaeota archaeon]
MQEVTLEQALADPKKREEFLREIEEKAEYYATKYHACSRAVLLAMRDKFKIELGTAFRAATGMAAGIGLMGYLGMTCGALVGAVMGLGIMYGLDPEEYLAGDEQRKRYYVYRLSKKMVQKFLEEFGTFSCREIHMQLFGRWFNLWDPKQREIYYEKIGATSPSGCPSVARRAARWVAEIILEEESRRRSAVTKS